MIYPDRYTSQTDERLIEMLRDGDTEIAEYLCDKYKNLVRGKAKSMYILGAEPEDLIQEGMIGLFKAVRDYDAGRDASFATFANLCVSRQMYKMIQSSQRHKSIPLNNYISLYSDDEGDEGSNLMDTLASAPESNPETAVIDKENVDNLVDAIERELSSFEREVLQLRLTGMGYVEIAKVLGRDEKSTDNALSRIKSKIRKTLA